MGILANLKSTVAAYVLPWAEFNATPGTIADGDQAPLQVDPNGNLRTAEQFASAAENNAIGAMYTLDKAVPTADGAWTITSSGTGGVGTAGINIKASAGRIRRVFAVNSNTTTGFYIQVHNKASAPVNNDQPAVRRWIAARTADMAARNDTVIDFGPAGLYLGTGISIAASTIPDKLTLIGAADLHYSVEWI